MVNQNLYLLTTAVQLHKCLDQFSKLESHNADDKEKYRFVRLYIIHLYSTENGSNYTVTAGCQS